MFMVNKDYQNYVETMSAARRSIIAKCHAPRYG